jgi:ribonuclease BN (tRNA processing enzyme)
VNVKFYGVRGSTPCSCDANRRYGGNTACVVLEGFDEHPIVLDLGTGLRFWGAELDEHGFTATALVSHLHWDHVQGLPFFTPMHHSGSSLHIIGPEQGDVGLREAFSGFLCQPYFPVGIEDLAGTFSFQSVGAETFAIGECSVTSRWVPHNGPTVGYRLEANNRSIAYISDHQQPGCQSTYVNPAVLELCEGVDVLIHDAQFTDAEFAKKFDWGHCTVDYALEVARQAKVNQLVLFHHDPSHSDDIVDDLADRLRAPAALDGIEVIAAAEGLKIEL